MKLYFVLIILLSITGLALAYYAVPATCTTSCESGYYQRPYPDCSCILLTCTSSCPTGQTQNAYPDCTCVAITCITACPVGLNQNAYPDCTCYNTTIVLPSILITPGGNVTYIMTCNTSTSCADWSACASNGKETRICTKTESCKCIPSAACGISYNCTCRGEPYENISSYSETQSCNYGCIFDNPKCSEGYVCLSNKCVLKECENDSDCNDNNSCTGDSCSSYKCSHLEQNGCGLGNTCVAFGTREIINTTPSYCAIGGAWILQRNENSTCQNNYECLSNQCSNGACIDISKQVKETQGALEGISKMINDIWNAIAGFFGFKK